MQPNGTSNYLTAGWAFGNDDAKSSVAISRDRLRFLDGNNVWHRFLDDGLPEEIGELWFTSWTPGFSYDGQRRVDYVSSVEDIKIQVMPGIDPALWTIGSSTGTR